MHTSSEISRGEDMILLLKGSGNCYLAVEFGISSGAWLLVAWSWREEEAARCPGSEFGDAGCCGSKRVWRWKMGDGLKEFGKFLSAPLY